MTLVPLAEVPESPGDGFAEALEAAGLSVVRIARVWHVSDAAAARAIIAAGITPPDPPTPPLVELEQVLEAMVLGSLMTRAEALVCARTGTMPASIATPLLDGMDATQAFRINLAWAARNWHRRDAKLWRVMVAQNVLTKREVDAIFRAAAALD